MNVGAHVHWRRVEDCVVVLDERQGRYSAIGADGVAAWDRAVESAAEDGDRPLVESFIARGWMSREAPAARRSSPVRRAAPRRARVGGALVCLVRAFAEVRYRGFAASYGRAKRVAEGAALSKAVAQSDAALEAAVARFHRAEAWVLSTRELADCLPRSLALFTYLRGPDSTCVIGSGSSSIPSRRMPGSRTGVAGRSSISTAGQPCSRRSQPWERRERPFRHRCRSGQARAGAGRTGSALRPRRRLRGRTGRRLRRRSGRGRPRRLHAPWRWLRRPRARPVWRRRRRSGAGQRGACAGFARRPAVVLPPAGRKPAGREFASIS